MSLLPGSATLDHQGRWSTWTFWSVAAIEEDSDKVAKETTMLQGAALLMHVNVVWGLSSFDGEGVGTWKWAMPLCLGLEGNDYRVGVVQLHQLFFPSLSMFQHRPWSESH